MRKRKHAVSAFMLTIPIWVIAVVAMLGAMIGDCLAELGHSCPTDGERRLRLLWIGLVALGVNLTALWLLFRFYWSEEP